MYSGIFQKLNHTHYRHCRLWLFLAAVQGAPVQAALTVDIQDPNCDDVAGTPYCEIQPAVQAAVSGDSIEVAAGTYRGVFGFNGVVVVPAEKSITIQGAGAGDTILQGSTLGRRGIVVQHLGSATISGITVLGVRVPEAPAGSDRQHGGGVLNQGTLVIRDCVISDNETAGNGGGIYSGNFYDTSLTVERCVIRDNLSTATDITFSHSGGGGIYAIGEMTVRDSLIYNNACHQSGGGIFLDLLNFESRGSVSNTTVMQNSALIGGGIDSFGNMKVESSSVLLNRAIRDSSGQGGGISANFGARLTIVNSLVYGNLAASNGGGIRQGTATTALYNTTVSNNSIDNGNGGGIYKSFEAGTGSFSLNNSLLSGNKDRSSNGELSPDCSGPIHSSGFNLIADTTGCTFDSSAGDSINVDAALNVTVAGTGAELAVTVGFFEDSPAIDAGNVSGCLDDQGALISADINAVARPADGDGDGSAVCDIGAFEGPIAPAQAPDNNPPGSDSPKNGDGTANQSGGGGGSLGFPFHLLLVGLIFVRFRNAASKRR